MKKYKVTKDIYDRVVDYFNHYIFHRFDDDGYYVKLYNHHKSELAAAGIIVIDIDEPL